MSTNGGRGTVALGSERPVIARDGIEIFDPDKGLAGEGGGRESATAGERMVGGKEGDARLAEERQGGEAGGGEGLPDETDVTETGADASGGVVEGGVAQGDGNIGPLGGEVAEQARGELEERGGEQAKRERASTDGGEADVGDGGIEAAEGRGQLALEAAAGGGEADGTGGAFKEGEAEFLFELADLGAESLLGQVEVGGGAREIELSGQDEKGAEVAEFDIHNQ